MKNDYQSFESWNDLNRELPERFEENAICYAYPMHLIDLGLEFEQLRSGPNWQGGLMTLTTCKHRMRSGMYVEEWPRTWIAGFTPKSCGENYLLFLAKVSRAFESNYSLGRFLLSAHPEVYNKKLAQNDTRGDIYEPRGDLQGAEIFKIENYKDPIRDHTRWEMKKGSPKWHKDISYIGFGDRAPSVFILNPVFLYSKPKYVASRKLYRSGYKTLINEFIHTSVSRIDTP